MIVIRSIVLRYVLLALAGCVMLGWSSPASAHVGGASFTATTSPYVLDVGYDPVAFIAGQSSRFDFVLSDEKTGAPVVFDQVWVRITNENGTQLATGLFRQPFGPTTLLFMFAQPGAYSVQSSFRDTKGNEIAAASFPFTVSPGDEPAVPFKNVLVILCVFIIGAVIGASALYALRGRVGR